MTPAAETAVLFDLDGTLVDTNYHHGIAWYRAFRDAGFVLPLWRIHRHVGMGGDKLVPALVGEDTDREQGDALRDAHAARYRELVGEVSALEGAHQLLVALRDAGHLIVLASSSQREHLDRYLGLLGARGMIAAATTADDADESKPAPDLIEAAIGRVDARPLAMVGDSPWDVESAGRSSLPCVALLTGGYSERELRDAGAVAVFASLSELRARLDETPIGA
jgi:phosphoglycolate phosphatase-like HAD superfamily hydrolase